jgi:hypothetical protein
LLLLVLVLLLLLTLLVVVVLSMLLGGGEWFTKLAGRGAGPGCLAAHLDDVQACMPRRSAALSAREPSYLAMTYALGS